MRGDKDEEKVISPMFPRLHVNDTERGGPRAPPRNKMALYEQLSVPSQQSFSSRSVVPLPPTNGVSRLVPSPSSSSAHGCGGQERSRFTPFCNSPAPCHSTEKPRSHSSIGANLGSTIACHESAKPVDHHKSLSAPRPLQQPIPPNFPNFRNLSLKKHNGEDAPPTLSRSGVVSNSTDTRQRKDQFPLFRPSSSIQGTDQNSRQHARNLSGDSPKSCQEPTDRYISLSSTKERACGSLKRVRESSDQNHHRSLLEAVSKRRGLFQEAVAPREKTKTTLAEDTCSRPAAGGNDKECGSVRVGETEKDNEISDSSMVDSVSVLDISPDDVVGVIGEKHFLKARRAIVNQQRVFAVQVFELHRLIKVQRLIAESPHLLLEHALSLRKPSSKGSLAKKLQSEPILEPRNGSQIPNGGATECRAESALPKLPIPLPLPLPLPLVDESSKGLASHKPFYRPYTGTTQPPQPLAPDPKPSPWCFHPPPGNQWLVPVMSPSEGFVYKPYTGPGPPNAGLMAPVYGGYDPINAGFGILPGTTPMGQGYFPPYGMNPSASGSAVEQVSPFTKGQEDQQSNVDINLAMSSQMSRAISCRVKKQASKESEVQGSTASSPSSRINGEALTLFPLASDLNAGEPPARVIKVVPHNPRSATESAARILQLIQEERKQFD